MTLPARYQQLTLLPPGVADRATPLAAARAALAETDQATTAHEARQATARLTAQLTGLARARGRTPIPKPTPRSSSIRRG